MNELEKLFKKLSPKDRVKLLQYAQELQSTPETFSIIKLKNSDFYRTRKGRWRFIFHYVGDTVVIDNIRLRDEKTYRDV